MPLQLTPDVEAIVAAYLRANADVAALAGDRIGGRTPETLQDPWVRVTQIDDQPAPRSRALHLVSVFLQLDCYGGAGDPAIAHEEASELVRTVRHVLHELPGPHAEGVVASVTFGGSHRAPDPSLTPPRERFTLDVTVVVHP